MRRSRSASSAVAVIVLPRSRPAPRPASSASQPRQGALRRQYRDPAERYARRADTALAAGAGEGGFPARWRGRRRARWRVGHDGPMSSARATALDMIKFLDASPSPYHAAAEARGRLTAAGFAEVPLNGNWPSGGGRYVTADGGSLFAGVVPEGSAPHAPFRLLGAHTDSPTLRVKPPPDTGRAGVRQLGVEVYGGPLLNSRLDRDLGLAGRPVVRKAMRPLFLRIRVNRPMLRGPHIAIPLVPS